MSNCGPASSQGLSECLLQPAHGKLAQWGFLTLPGRRARQVVEDQHKFRKLVGRDLRPQEGHDLIEGDRFILLWYKARTDTLAQPRIRHTDNRSIADLGMLIEDFLDFARI